MKWQEALKIWNGHHKTINPTHVWAMPRKGTPEHAQVKAIQSGVMPDHSTFKEAVKAILSGTKKADMAKAIKAENKRAKAKLKERTAASSSNAAPAPDANADRQAKALSQLRQVESATKARNAERAAAADAFTLPKLSSKAIVVQPRDYAKYVRTYVSAEDAPALVAALQENYPDGAKLWRPYKAIRAKEMDE